MTINYDDENGENSLFLFYSHPHLSLHEFSFAGGGVTDGLSTEKKWIRMERRVKRQRIAAVEMNMQKQNLSALHDK